MRRSFRTFLPLLLVSAWLAGCGQRTTTTSEETSADSLLSANPTEQTSGDLTPQTEYQEPAAEAPPTPAPSRQPSRAPSRPSREPSREPAREPVAQGVTVPAGTPLKISVNAKISSESAQAGDTWSGVVKEPVVVGNDVVIPAGSTVTGEVVGAKEAQKGSRAFLVLAVRAVEANGKSYSVSARTDSIIAGSTRARNLGAIAGGAAAGALLGKAIGGSGKGALIGGIVGGAAATGAVAASKGYQVELKEGTEITFYTNNSVSIRT
jgi:hypothetical protein